jgi:hypothetical protein
VRNGRVRDAQDMVECARMEKGHHASHEGERRNDQISAIPTSTIYTSGFSKKKKKKCLRRKPCSRLGGCFGSCRQHDNGGK